MPYIENKQRRKELDKIIDYLKNKAFPRANDTYDLLCRALLQWFLYHIDGKHAKYPMYQLFQTLDVKPNGEINYILFKYCKYYIKPSYNNYKLYVGCLHDLIYKIETEKRGSFEVDHVSYMRDFISDIRLSILEMYREIIGPYEELKKSVNGDV
jgi:hypothetical protein